MPCENSVTYKSCGTIRATIRCDSSTPIGSIQFTPDTDHFIKHGNKCYAAFVSESSDLNIHSALLDDDKNGNRWVALEYASDPAEQLVGAFAIAAAMHVKVEVALSVPASSSDFGKVIAIAIPAK